MSPEAKDFLTYDYAELKDLAKSFLTLISATLVFSITFSDKVIELQRAGKRARTLLFSSWTLLIAATIGSGLALCLNYEAQLYAAHEGTQEYFAAIRRMQEYGIEIGYEQFYIRAGQIMFLSGLCFVVGLLLLLLSSRNAAKSRVALTASEITGVAGAHHVEAVSAEAGNTPTS